MKTTTSLFVAMAIITFTAIFSSCSLSESKATENQPDTVKIVSTSSVDTVTRNGNTLLKIQTPSGMYVADYTDTKIEKMLLEARPGQDYFLEISVIRNSKEFSQTSKGRHYGRVNSYSINPIVSRSRN